MRIDYKKKYLKYKLKYLQAKQTFKGGMEVGGAAEEGGLRVEVSTDAETRSICALPTDAVRDAIAHAFDRPVEHIEVVGFGDDEVAPCDTFEELGIEDGARLSVSFRAPKATVEEVVAETIELNPHLTRERLMEYVEVDAEDASRVKGHVVWASLGIDALPESIGDLTVGGDLGLNYNNLATLPASFGSLTVGGNLGLGNNNLAPLPTSFGSLQVGGEVYLVDNPVAASRPHFDGLYLVLE